MNTSSDPAAAESQPDLSPLPYDAILIVGFGGPEKREDVMPFLENVTRDRNVPRERLLEVAEHYYHFDGVSPINQQVRDLIDALQPELRNRNIYLPVYWGNRNWDPSLPDTMREMTAAGHHHALAVVLAAYSSYSSCRQYRENVYAARDAVGPDAPVCDKMRVFFNHPDFISANVDRLREGIIHLSGEGQLGYHIAFTAHSIPSSMAAGCNYEIQLKETCRLIAEQLGLPADRWALVYQSRSGRPEDPWLEPDILDHCKALSAQGVQHLILHPVGFLSDHMEVLYDLDDEAAKLCRGLGIEMVRSATVGTHPRFVSMLGGLIQERIRHEQPRRAIGQYGPNHDVCPANCCPAPTRPPGRSTTQP